MLRAITNPVTPDAASVAASRLTSMSGKVFIQRYLYKYRILYNTIVMNHPTTQLNLSDRYLVTLKEDNETYIDETYALMTVSTPEDLEESLENMVDEFLEEEKPSFGSRHFVGVENLEKIDEEDYNTLNQYLEEY